MSPLHVGTRKQMSYSGLELVFEKNDIYFLETSSDICLNHCLLKYYFLFHYWILDTKFAAAAESLQSCLTLSSPIDGSPPGSPVPGILQARTLEWVAISFSNA